MSGYIELQAVQAHNKEMRRVAAAARRRRRFRRR
jgi:hypothetical protein